MFTSAGCAKRSTAPAKLFGASPFLPLLCRCLYALDRRPFLSTPDAGEFVINVKRPSGTRIKLTNDYVEVQVGKIGNCLIYPRT